MNILIITRWYPKDKNDISGIFVKEQAELISTRHRVSLFHVVIDYRSFGLLNNFQISNKQVNNHLSVTRLIFSRSFPIFNQINFIFGAYYEILKRIKGDKFDIIHCHVTFQSGVIGALISGKLNIPLVITEHASSLKDTFFTIIHKKITIWTMNKASCLIAVSTPSANVMNSITGLSFAVLPNVIDTDAFAFFHQSDHDSINIGILGGYDTNHKGLDLLLLAVAELKVKNHIHIHIGGDGSLRNQYEIFAEELGLKESCTFYGNIPPADRREFFKKIDFFVLPSRKESFGIVIIEALACGKPVISTRCGGPEEIIVKEVGMLVDIGDVKGLSSAIEKMCEDYKNFIPCDLHNYVQEKYGKNVFLYDLEKLYLQIIK